MGCGAHADAWKESVTALLYKKGDHMCVSNFRRVGLEAALYKLYTKLTTCALVDYAEQTGIEYQPVGISAEAGHHPAPGNAHICLGRRQAL